MRHHLSKIVFVLFALIAKPAKVQEQPVPVANLPTEQQVFEEHLEHLTPSMRRYIHRLYSDYSRNSWKYNSKSAICKYITKQHQAAEKMFRYYDDPINKRLVTEIAYGASTCPLNHGLDVDLAISLWTNEAGFLNCPGDKSRVVHYKWHGKIRKKRVKNPPSKWAYGYGQEHLEDAYWNLRARRLDPRGLTTEDLLYFRLMNLDISASILAIKIHQFGLINGIKAYNGGDNGWQDGRADKYYDSVMSIYKTRAQWHEPGK